MTEEGDTHSAYVAGHVRFHAYALFPVTAEVALPCTADFWWTAR